MKPSELGLVVPGDEFRDRQWETIEETTDTNKRYILIDAPPGSGKSVIGLGAAQRTGLPAIVLTADKLLQAQYQSVSPDNTLLLMGRNEYRCLADKAGEMTVDKAPCQFLGCPHKRSGDCPYYGLTKELKENLRSYTAAIMNYTHYLFMRRYAGLGHSGTLVCDEADLLEKELLGFTGVSLRNSLLFKYGLKPPVPGADLSEVILWAANQAAVIGVLMGRYAPRGDPNRTTIEDVEAAMEGDESMKNYLGIQRLRQMNNVIRTAVKEEEWVLDRDPDGLRIKPLNIAEAEVDGAGPPMDFLMDNAQKVVFMSGTILNAGAFCDILGLDMKRVLYIELPSTFRPERRPVIYDPVARMTNATKLDAWPDMVSGLDERLERFIGKRGLIHTSSYELAHYVKRHSRYGDYMYVPGREARKDVIASHSERRGFIVSPSMMRGVDLHHDLCDVIFWLKVPYADLSDPWVSARAKQSKKWYLYETLKNFIQGSSRGMRSSDDRCVTYVLDEMFMSLYKQVKYMVPNWFKEALVGI